MRSPWSYQHITNLFRNTFSNLGTIGTFDDVVQGIEKSIVLDVPYWDWLDKSDQVRQYLSNKQKNFEYVWPFIRDSFPYCYCLISSKAVAITPFFPLVDMIPTFVDCPRRIFMSATINDDSALIQIFDADKESIAKPITSESSVGVSERMILVSDWMNFGAEDKQNISTLLREIATSIAKESELGTVILVPSETASKQWAEVATVADSTQKVSEWVRKLQNHSSFGPVVFANRYDGIDLQGDSCRLLILDGLPYGSNEYDLYFASIFIGSFSFNSALAQRIEQGMGRGARGTDDYCVVIITNKKLTSWLSRSANLNFLTSPTLAQFKMGEEISRDIKDKNDFINTIDQCLNRDNDWISYHAQILSDNLSNLAQNNSHNNIALNHAKTERKVFKLLRSGHYEKAINTLEKYWQSNNQIDSQTKGWLEQLAARIAYQSGDKNLAQRYQKNAYSNNPSLLRPESSQPYIPLIIPSKQAKGIIDKLDDFNPKRGFISHFENIVSHLVPEATSNQFEQALADFGNLLGFATQRPESNFDKDNPKKGPDVLWLFDNMGLIIEAKSRKKPENPLKKEDYGQLLTSVEWFKAEYPNCSYVPISILNNPVNTSAIIINDVKALTFDKLNELIGNSYRFFEELCSYIDSREQLIVRCEKLLQDSNLQPQKIIEIYLLDFQEINE